MRVFVTGATGYLGRSVISELLEHGHEVVGLARNDASQAMLRALHAVPVTGQGTDIEQLAEILKETQGIIHLASTFPTSESADEDDWRPSSRIVLGMLRNLIEACQLNRRAQTLVFPSFYGVYGHHGDDWVTEDTSIKPDSFSEYFVTAEEILAEATSKRAIRGVILRMGLIYTADAPHTRGLVYGLSRGQAPVMGRGRRYWPMLHAADAAQALRLAVEQAPSGDTFNICDNDPVQQGLLYERLANWIGAPKPSSRGTSELSPYMGNVSLPALRFSVRMSNQKARQWMGFVPHYPTYEEGFVSVLQEISERKKSQSPTQKS